MNLQKLIATREGHRRLITILLEKLTHESTVSEKTALLDIVHQKAEVIKTLNDKITSHPDIPDLTQELVESDEYSIELELKLRRLSGTTQQDRENRNTSAVTDQGNADVSTLQQMHRVNTNHKLPKLTLPVFDGDIALWQTFWDSYESAIHLNNTLSDVQKFSYLRSLLQGQAASAIAGLPLTNANYQSAIDLLKQRFGQVHKIINSYMQALIDMPAARNSVEGLRTFHDRIETNIRGLESLGQCQDSFGDLLVPIIFKKLPPEVRQNLAREHGDTMWNLHDLRSSIAKEISVLEAGQFQQASSPELHFPTATFFTGTENRSLKKRPTEREKAKKITCPFCGDNHTPISCKKVTGVKDRLAIIKQKRLCYNCLFSSHSVSTCKSKFRCRHCHRKHHTAICNDQRSAAPATQPALNPNAPPFKTSGAASGAAILHSTTEVTSDILLKTAVADVASTTCSTPANILFDEGSQRSFMTETFAHTIELDYTGCENVTLASFGGQSQQVRSLKTARVYLQAENREVIPLDVLIVPEIAVPLPTYPKEVQNLKYLQGLKLAHPVSHGGVFEVNILIGADHFWKIVGNEIVRGNGPTAVKSKVGYLLSGPLPVSTPQPTASHVLNVLTTPPGVMELDRFWKLESLGISSDEDAAPTSGVMDTYIENSIKFEDGRYVAKLPWKEDHPALPTNYAVCKRRTENTVRRLAQEPEMLNAYGRIIDDQLNRGFIEKVDTSVIPAHDVHYLPHHGVRKDSITTPLRIVYDCSCRQSRDSPSLNDCLLSTPPELNDLTGILLRFRMEKYGVTTDIEKAFLHVGLDEQDRDVTRFLWLSDPGDPDSALTTYRFKTVLFGATCSPFILSATILKHLQINEDKWGSQYLKNDLYVDNVISSFPRETALQQYYSESRNLMSSAGFNLRSWSSNSEKLRAKAASEHVLDEDTCTKVLGMRWDSTNDYIEFPEKPIDCPIVATKREILSQTSRLYDPMGFLSPVTVRAKVLLQDLWQQKFDWDTPLSEHLQDRWRVLVSDLNCASSVTLPRYYFDGGADSTSDRSIHVFCDASMTAYGAAAYICNGEQSTLMMSKNRVAPLKVLTLPKLELMAAVVGARMCQHLLKNTQITEVHLWSDSQIVLQWIESTKPLPRFVRNRIAEIHELTDNRKWKYCPTFDNPADLLTRGITAKQFRDSEIWWKGPKWLCDKAKWPRWDQTSVLLSTCEEPSDGEQYSLRTVNGIHAVMNIDSYSRLSKLLRVTAYVLRFVHNCRRRCQDKQTSALKPQEIQSAEILWIKSCQATIFQAEIDNMKTSKSRLPLVRQLRLFVDEIGCIRCGGRLHNAPIEETAKFPFLLPGKHSLTRLIIQDAHERILHAGISSTVTHLRQKYWIIAIRQNTKTVLRKCVVCKKVDGKPYSIPDPPPLPKYRLQDCDPFTVTGVDFTGALYVRDHTGKETKAYVCLFTCATTRAIHLELVQDLSEETFMQAYRRFCSRRSVPDVMISDNATTYKAAANSIQQLFRSTKIQEDLSHKGTQWLFIPTRAPWYGGFWERLIGLTKTVLKKVLGRSYISYDELQTVVTEVEAVLNDRPLTYASSDYMDAEPLTPAHLLHGRRLTTLPYPGEPVDANTAASVISDRLTTTRRARRQRDIINHFRERWKSEYLTALREHHQTTGNNRQTIQAGDVVQVQDERPRPTWKLAVVQRLVTGNDGLVRAAVVKTQHSETTRPIANLYPLEVI